MKKIERKKKKKVPKTEEDEEGEEEDEEMDEDIVRFCRRQKAKKMKEGYRHCRKQISKWAGL